MIRERKSKEERFDALKDIAEYQLKVLSAAEKIANKKILLFDDIYTTGSTANECSKILKKSGAKQVGVLTIAKD